METMSGMPSPLKSPTATIGSASAPPPNGSGIGTFKKPLPPPTSVAVPSSEFVLLVSRNETVPDGEIAPLVPTLAVSAYIFVASGPATEAMVNVVRSPGGRGPTVCPTAAEELAAPAKVPRNTAL
jgi:hypothetical protein